MDKSRAEVLKALGTFLREQKWFPSFHSVNAWISPDKRYRIQASVYGVYEDRNTPKGWKPLLFGSWNKVGVENGKLTGLEPVRN
jgi:hypothetical protein